MNPGRPFNQRGPRGGVKNATGWLLAGVFGLGLSSCESFPERGEGAAPASSGTTGPYRDPRYLDRQSSQGPATYPSRNAPYF